MDTTPKIISKEPLVNILMLTYNRAHFIREAISSVVNQTYQNWELVVIDDGSTDTTENVVKVFKDDRIRYIKHQKNAGLFARRKESVSYANGKYTAILDSDDFWISSNKIAEQVAFLETSKEHVLVGTMAKLINKSGEKIGQCSFAVNNMLIRSKILAHNQFTHSSILIRTEELKKTNGYQPTLAEDLELILQLGMFGKLANLPNLYTAHRVHTDSENDHGIKMASAVHQIILMHKNYPHYTLARLISYLRLFLGILKKDYHSNHKNVTPEAK